MVPKQLRVLGKVDWQKFYGKLLIMSVEDKGLRIGPVEAAHTLHSLFWDPGVTLEMVRAQFREVAEGYVRLGQQSLWARMPQEAAICIIMGIDPQTGLSFQDQPETLIRRYSKTADGFLGTVQESYDGFMADPTIQRELTREREMNAAEEASNPLNLPSSNP